ncbi:hypothetical protein ADUPG1_010500, partial [Aduncisulcus paluster]
MSGECSPQHPQRIRQIVLTDSLCSNIIVIIKHLQLFPNLEKIYINTKPKYEKSSYFQLRRPDSFDDVISFPLQYRSGLSFNKWYKTEERRRRTAQHSKKDIDEVSVITQLFAKVGEFFQHFTGPSSIEQSIRSESGKINVLAVIHRQTIKQKDLAWRFGAIPFEEMHPDGKIVFYREKSSIEQLKQIISQRGDKRKSRLASELSLRLGSSSSPSKPSKDKLSIPISLFSMEMKELLHNNMFVNTPLHSSNAARLFPINPPLSITSTISINSHVSDIVHDDLPTSLGPSMFPPIDVHVIDGEKDEDEALPQLTSHSSSSDDRRDDGMSSESSRVDDTGGIILKPSTSKTGDKNTLSKDMKERFLPELNVGGHSSHPSSRGGHKRGGSLAAVSSLSHSIVGEFVDLGSDIFSTDLGSEHEKSESDTFYRASRDTMPWSRDDRRHAGEQYFDGSGDTGADKTKGKGGDIVHWFKNVMENIGSWLGVKQTEGQDLEEGDQSAALMRDIGVKSKKGGEDKDRIGAFMDDEVTGGGTASFPITSVALKQDQEHQREGSGDETEKKSLEETARGVLNSIFSFIGAPTIPAPISPPDSSPMPISHAMYSQCVVSSCRRRCSSIHGVPHLISILTHSLPSLLYIDDVCVRDRAGNGESSGHAINVLSSNESSVPSSSDDHEEIDGDEDSTDHALNLSIVTPIRSEHPHSRVSNHCGVSSAYISMSGYNVSLVANTHVGNIGNSIVSLSLAPYWAPSVDLCSGLKYMGSELFGASERTFESAHGVLLHSVHSYYCMEERKQRREQRRREKEQRRTKLREMRDAGHLISEHALNLSIVTPIRSEHPHSRVSNHCGVSSAYISMSGYNVSLVANTHVGNIGNSIVSLSLAPYWAPSVDLCSGLKYMGSELFGASERTFESAHGVLLHSVHSYYCMEERKQRREQRRREKEQRRTKLREMRDAGHLISEHALMKLEERSELKFDSIPNRSVLHEPNVYYLFHLYRKRREFHYLSFSRIPLLFPNSIDMSNERSESHLSDARSLDSEHSYPMIGIESETSSQTSTTSKDDDGKDFRDSYGHSHHRRHVKYSSRGSAALSASSSFSSLDGTSSSGTLGSAGITGQRKEVVVDRQKDSHSSHFGSIYGGGGIKLSIAPMTRSERLRCIQMKTRAQRLSILGMRKNLKNSNATFNTNPLAAGNGKSNYNRLSLRGGNRCFWHIQNPLTFAGGSFKNWMPSNQIDTCAIWQIKRSRKQRRALSPREAEASLKKNSTSGLGRSGRRSSSIDRHNEREEFSDDILRNESLSSYSTGDEFGEHVVKKDTMGTEVLQRLMGNSIVRGDIKGMLQYLTKTIMKKIPISTSHSFDSLRMFNELTSNPNHKQSFLLKFLQSPPKPQPKTTHLTTLPALSLPFSFGFPTHILSIAPSLTICTTLSSLCLCIPSSDYIRSRLIQWKLKCDVQWKKYIAEGKEERKKPKKEIQAIRDDDALESEACLHLPQDVSEPDFTESSLSDSNNQEGSSSDNQQIIQTLYTPSQIHGKYIFSQIPFCSINGTDEKVTKSYFIPDVCALKRVNPTGIAYHKPSNNVLISSTRGRTYVHPLSNLLNSPTSRYGNETGRA